MKITKITRTEERTEIEIQLPYFCKSSDGETYLKICKEEAIGEVWGTIKVNIGTYWYSVGTHSTSGSEIALMTECTEAEFTSAKESALKEIEQVNNLNK